MPRYDRISAIKSGDAVLQTVISNNFLRAETVLNNLDSANYGGSSIQSAKISNNAIMSQHISNSSLGSAQLSDGVVRQTNIKYKRTDEGVRVVFVGTSPPAAMVGVCRFSHTLAVAGSAATYNYAYTDALEGNPGFTDTPVMGTPGVLVGTANSSPQEVRVTAIDSASADVSFQWAAAATHTVTVYMHFNAGLS